jgi:hypothetical protein
MVSRIAVVAVFVLAGLVAIGLGGPAVDSPGQQVAGREVAGTVTFTDEDGTTLGTVQVVLADSSKERYLGLSNTDGLPADTGMLFVYGEEAERTFVMRHMNYPIDMVFIGADGRVTTIHHAETEVNDDPGDDLTPYPGRAKWVLEVPHGWTTEHGVEPGDRASIT